MRKALVITFGLLALILYISIEGCKRETKSACDGKIRISSIVKTAAIVGRSDARITVVAEGGTGIKYSINDTSFQDAGTFTNLASKDYTITAQNSDGCTDKLKITVESMVDPCQGVVIAISTTKRDANPGQFDGTITASATGGDDITYKINNSAYQADGNFTGLAPGTYTITAKSNLGCEGTASVTIGTINPCASVTVSVTGTFVNPVIGQSNGSISVTATGGSGFTYRLNGGAAQGSGTFSNLAAGTYTVTATSSIGCTGTSAAFNLVGTNPCTGVTIVVSGTKTNPSTATSTNGTITASATGSTGLTYSLNGGAYQATGAFTNLAVGNYTVTARNTNGCTGSGTFSLVDNCTTYTINVTPTVTNVVQCSSPTNNGSITVSASGSSNYTYSFNNGSTFSASNVLTNAATGTYNIVVRDGVGCPKSASATVSLAPAGPLFSAVVTLMNSSCISCHRASGVGNYAPDLTQACNIVTFWDRIQIRINATANPMPPAPNVLSAADKLKVTNWVNAGHTYDK